LCQIIIYFCANLNSTTAQLAKVEAIQEFPWRTAIQAAVAALPDDLIQ
jgi:hypothetical protein